MYGRIRAIAGLVAPQDLFKRDLKISHLKEELLTLKQQSLMPQPEKLKLIVLKSTEDLEKKTDEHLKKCIKQINHL